MDNKVVSLIKKNNYYFRAFIFGIALSFIMFIPFIIRDGGRFLFYGDFNVQQIPFYQIAHDAITNGRWGWNQYTDLGASFIGSYAFSLIGSPFFLITLFFPNGMIEHLMGPLLILKFGCATLTAFIYLNRYVKVKDYAIIGALLYAFSGYSIYNIFFNNFHESLIFFPLILAALDEYMDTGKRGLFALAVFANCFVNYYFFVGQVTFCVIYFFVRLFMKSYRITIKNFLFLAFEAVLGLGLSCILLIPAILAVSQNNRVDNIIMGWDALVYSNTQRYVHIIQSFFFPPDLAARPNFTPDSQSKWASLGAWLPLFGMTGVVAWLNRDRAHWLKTLLIVLFFFALIPGLNSSFQFFNAAYYARWYYMLTLIMALATIMSLESSKTNWGKSIKLCFSITVAISVLIGFMPDMETQNSEEVLVFGLADYPTRFWAYVAIALICFAVMIFMFVYVKKENLKNVCIFFVSIISVIYGMYFITIGKAQSDDPYNHLIPYALNEGVDLPIEIADDERSDFYSSLDNSGMFWKISTIQAFHSVVPGSVMEFYDYIGVQRDVGSRADTSHHALRGLTSVKWLFDDDHDTDYFAGENFETPAMPGFAYYGNANGFDIWQNEYYIPMGFTYDSYITKSKADTLSDGQREELMLKTAIIPDDDVSIWSAVLPEYNLEDADYTEEAYFEDCIARAEISAESFEYTNNGFRAIIDAPQDTAVFFSIPLEDGWSANVNGFNTRILKTNIGFMSVLVSEGENIMIEFNYTTPGLDLGMVVTIICIMIYIVYVIAFKVSEKRTLRGVEDFAQLRKIKPFSFYSKDTNSGFRKKTEKGFLRRKR